VQAHKKEAAAVPQLPVDKSHDDDDKASSADGSSGVMMELPREGSYSKPEEAPASKDEDKTENPFEKIVTTVKKEIGF
jgi:hypothetical protein